MKKYPLILVAAILLLTLSSCTGDQTTLEEPEISSGIVGMGNPSAVYCQELGYEFKTVPDPEGERGICILPEGQECDAWDFLEGECGLEHSYCAQQGLDTVLKHDGKNGLTQSYAVCMDGNGAEIGAAVELMDLEEKTLGCGVGLEETHTPDASGAEPAPPLDFTPPASFDWTDNGGNWLTPVRNQLSCGSCWAFAAVGVAESVINIGRNDPTYDINLSEQYLVSDCHPDTTAWGGYQNCCGGWNDLALEYIRDEGIPDDDCMPYDEDGGCYPCTSNSYPTPPVCGSSCDDDSGGACSDSDCSERCPNWASELYYIQDTGYLGNWAADSTMKQYLVDYGPLAVSVGIGSSVGGGFGQAGFAGDVYSCSDDISTSHAVVVVGYEDYLPQPPPTEPQGYWVVRNSWGTWNGDGYYKLAYGECAVNKYPYYATDNLVPYTPSDPAPADETVAILINSDLSWTGGDPNPGDTVTYDVYFKADDPTPDVLACDDISLESCDPGTLDLNTTYYWQVVASDQYAESTIGPVWSFTTSATTLIDNVGFYVPDQNKWYIKNNQTDGWNDFISFKFGCSSPDWMPVAGDWNNDGVDTAGFYVPDQSKWYLKNNQTDGWTDFVAFNFAGPTGSLAVAGDWDNDGVDTVGFYVPSQGKWYLKNNQTNGWTDYVAFNFTGPTGSEPVVGDWDNDGVDTVGFYVPDQMKWYLKNNQINGWNDYVAFKFGGVTGSMAVAGDWDGDGEGTIGFYVPSQTKWYLKNNQNNGWFDYVDFKFGGPAGWKAVTGDWQ